MEVREGWWREEVISWMCLAGLSYISSHQHQKKEVKKTCLNVICSSLGKTSWGVLCLPCTFKCFLCCCWLFKEELEVWLKTLNDWSPLSQETDDMILWEGIHKVIMDDMRFLHEENQKKTGRSENDEEMVTQLVLPPCLLQFVSE